MKYDERWAEKMSVLHRGQPEGFQSACDGYVQCENQVRKMIYRLELQEMYNDEGKKHYKLLRLITYEIEEVVSIMLRQHRKVLTKDNYRNLCELNSIYHLEKIEVTFSGREEAEDIYPFEALSSKCPEWLLVHESVFYIKKEHVKWGTPRHIIQAMAALKIFLKLLYGNEVDQVISNQNAKKRNNSIFVPDSLFQVKAGF